MAENQIEEIKRKTDIVELISDHIGLKRAGTNFKGLCPFHAERTPSFMVSPELQIFKCFGCGLGGDVYRFLMEYEKIDFPEALKILAERAGVKLIPLRGYATFREKEEIYRLNHTLSEFYHYLLVSHKIGEVARQYLKTRGVGAEAIEVFNLGFAPDLQDSAFRFLASKKNYRPEVLEKAGIAVKRDNQYFDRFRGRIIFPLRDHYGNTLGFAGRVIKEAGEAAKYINSPDTLVYKKGNTLYGLDVTKQDIKKEGFAVVVEGELDAISSWQAGVKNVVAIKGSALTPEQAELLSRFCPQVRLALDSDIAGDKASRRGIEVVEKEGLEQKVVRLGSEHDSREYENDSREYKDPDDMAKSAPEKWREAVAKAEGIYDFLIDSTLAKFDRTTTEGKARISQEIAPILASIDDEIVRAACIKKVAGLLDVSEDAVAAQVAKKTLRQVSGDGEHAKEERGTKGKREVLEEYLLTLIFQSDPTRFLKEETLIFFKTPLALKLLKEYQKWVERKEKFNAKEFAKILPAELVDFYASLVLLEIKTDYTEREIEKTKKTLQALELREKIAALSREIRSAEGGGKGKDLPFLEKELTKVSNQITQLEASDIIEE